MTILVSLTCSAILALLGTLPQETQSALEVDSEGWTDLLADAGPMLNGWTRVPIPPEGTLDPSSQWVLDPDTGMLVCTGDKGHEWLRWEKPSTDGIFHVEWRFVPVTEGPDRYNSGVYVRNSIDGSLWHQAQTGGASGGYLFGQTLVDGQVQRVSTREEMTEQRVKPAGEWNVYEIIFDGPRIALWVNGAITSEWDACEVRSGHVGLESEGYRIEFRRVLLKSR
ncbi:3-keto-disaccharide hydrolase [Tautonia rosea]|uniref:3-keto-disaccharide hydrolase n=1 Tax=Tautonia rosea TaxID=2728037 RepID=UPI001474559C|nr:DUF1080 domain-containing protein [Tautonia rosea]